MTAQVYTVVGLTALVAALVAVVVFAILRFATAARDARRASVEEGGAAMLASALQDAVSRLREQERAFKARAEASERLSDEVIASIASGLMLVDADETVRIVNPAGRRLLGLGDGEVDGRRLGEVLARFPALRELIAEGLSSARPLVRRTVAAAPVDGEPGVTHLGVTVSPIVNLQRARHAVICLFTDLTAAVALEEQLRTKESLARLGELTAGLAHEFRNGLATIHGYARMLDPDALDSSGAACVRGIRQEAEALGQIVTRFLEFARPAAIATGTVDLGEVVALASADVRQEIERRGGELHVAGEFPVIEGDGVLLRQAFSNLCRNAVEACAAADQVPRLSIDGAVDAPAGQVRITVSDNGPGIERSHLSRIFQPFFTTKNGGMGLGLALVQKIVVTHNGRVTAATRQEGGATFVVMLPLPVHALTRPR